MPNAQQGDSRTEPTICILGIVLGNMDGSGRTPHHRTQMLGLQGEKVTPPTGYRIVAVDTASSQSVRDLASYRRDFELAQFFIDAYLAAEFDRSSNVRAPEDALWMQAVTLYGRAFGTGVRTTERPSIETLDDGQREAHIYFLDLRNKYVAHSVNEFEQTTVIAFLTDSSFTRPAITRVGQQHAFVSHMDDAEAQLLRTLCGVQIRDLKRRIKALHVLVAAELEEQGLDAVYKLPDLVTHTIRAQSVGKRRR